MITILIILYLIGVGVLSFVVAKYVPGKIDDLLWPVLTWPFMLAIFIIAIPILIPVVIYFIVQEYVKYTDEKPNCSFWTYLKY